MEIALPITSKIVFAEANVGEDGALHLHNPTLKLNSRAQFLRSLCLRG